MIELEAKFRSENQRLDLHIVLKEDEQLIVVLPTGAGKSVLYYGVLMLEDDEDNYHHIIHDLDGKHDWKMHCHRNHLRNGRQIQGGLHRSLLSLSQMQI